jgi:hypothetical protein
MTSSFYEDQQITSGLIMRRPASSFQCRLYNPKSTFFGNDLRGSDNFRLFRYEVSGCSFSALIVLEG